MAIYAMNPQNKSIIIRKYGKNGLENNAKIEDDNSKLKQAMSILLDILEENRRLETSKNQSAKAKLKLTKKDYDNLKQMYNIPLFAYTMEGLDLNTVLAISLKLGLFDGNYYSNNIISEALNLDEDTIRKILLDGLKIYRQRIYSLLSQNNPMVSENSLKRILTNIDLIENA